MSTETWGRGDAYESYVGRWSRPVARAFLEWLARPAGQRWLDVGCGTGALVQTILTVAAPDAVVGVDRSEGFVAYAREQVSEARARFAVGDAQALPVEADSFDVIVSGLMLNFVPDPALAAREMVRVARTGAIVATYVWDYAGEMQFMRYFWEAAAAVDPDAHAFDEGARFPLCRPEALAALWRDAGLHEVETRPIDVPTVFRDFDDYWSPFLGGQGAAPSYLLSLDEARRAVVRERVRSALPIAADGTIALRARAWAVKGRR